MESTQTGLANAHNLAACRLIEHLAAAGAKVMHHIVSHWMQHDARYQLAATERKCLHIQYLQDEIVADVKWHAKSSLLRRYQQ